MKQYVNPVELTAELLNTLIEKITVHEAVKGEEMCIRDRDSTTSSLIRCCVAQSFPTGILLYCEQVY